MKEIKKTQNIEQILKQWRWYLDWGNSRTLESGLDLEIQVITFSGESCRCLNVSFYSSFFFPSDPELVSKWNVLFSTIFLGEHEISLPIIEWQTLGMLESDNPGHLKKVSLKQTRCSPIYSVFFRSTCKCMVQSQVYKHNLFKLKALAKQLYTLWTKRNWFKQANLTF